MNYEYSLPVLLVSEFGPVQPQGLSLAYVWKENAQGKKNLKKIKNRFKSNK